MSQVKKLRVLGRALERRRSSTDETSRPNYWRSLEELDQTEEFRELAAKEFAAPPEEPTSDGRRRFLQLMGASFALAGGTTACRYEKDYVLPHTPAS